MFDKGRSDEGVDAGVGDDREELEGAEGAAGGIIAFDAVVGQRVYHYVDENRGANHHVHSS